ncbi:MAG TPA: endonuclease/exonuclease/phosphatase family protein [Polyangiaceae bacterium]|nr:endonuclease/exonuclease/phosphatase family protein [Polyangiaceae bacterium]
MRRLRALVFCAASLSAASSSAALPKGGRFSVITYNVAGLPEGISESHPAANLPVVGERLNHFDLALVQEDFAYADSLRLRLKLPFQSRPFVRGARYDFGDGLSLFSRFRFSEPERTAWSSCHGVTSDYFDCLTPKGFSVTTLELAEGVPLDVYDVHLDAGYSDGDRSARSSQLEQLAAAVLAHSAERAVLVGGDFNLEPSELGKLERLEHATGLADACSALQCSDMKRIDRVLYRGSTTLRVVPTAWRVAPGFIDAHGAALSDHDPVLVDFRWQRGR